MRSCEFSGSQPLFSVSCGFCAVSVGRILWQHQHSFQICRRLPFAAMARRTPASMNLSLGPDGSATVTEDPGTGTKTLFGHWVDTGSQVMVTFDAEEGKPAEPAMAFQPGHDGLQAVTWDRALWGKGNPPPMKKGGYKVKQTYWLTQNP